MKKVSIIIPVYNTSNYVDKCISSITNQTYSNIEIIVINDGSTDNSLEICKSLAIKDNRILIVDQKNQGVSVARNSGIDRASGDYIVFIDSDDWVANNYIEYLVNLCEKYECDVAQVSYRYVNKYAESFIVDMNRVETLKWSFYDLFSSSSRQYRAIVCGKIFNKKLFANFRFSIDRIFEDEEAAFFLLYNSNNIVISTAPLYYYRMTDNSIMRNNKTRINYDFLFLHEGIIDFLYKKKDYKIISIERKELCIRLMMRFCRLNKKENYEDAEKLLSYFKKHYYLIDSWKDIYWKEAIALKLFNFSPELFSFLENKTGTIKKAKIRRVQNS